MFKSLFFTVCTVALAAGCWCQNPASSNKAQDKTVVLGGLDPIQLASGNQVKGDPGIVSDYGRFRYCFSSEDDRKEFEADPDKNAVQGNGLSLRYKIAGGDPSKFFVYDHRIYLLDSDDSMADVKKDPAPYVKSFDSMKKVAIMLFPGVQIIDYSGPYEVFGEAGYEVYTVAATPDPILTTMCLTVTPAYTFDRCPKPDLVVLPGGDVPDGLDKSNPNINWILGSSKNGTQIMSVCNGAFWLAGAGLLDGKKATTFYGFLDVLKKSYPKIDVVSDRRFADNGQIVCTAGLSSGIDGALHLVEKFDGKGSAQAVALNMEYNWQTGDGFVRGDYSDKYLRRLIGYNLGFSGPDIKVLSVSGDRDKWNQTWEVSDPNLNQGSIMDHMSEKLGASGCKLVRSGSATADWDFKGEDGKPWVGSVDVQQGKDLSAWDIHITLRTKSG